MRNRWIQLQYSIVYNTDQPHYINHKGWSREFICCINAAKWKQKSTGLIFDQTQTNTAHNTAVKKGNLRMFISFFCNCHNAKMSLVIHNFGSFNTLMKNKEMDWTERESHTHTHKLINQLCCTFSVRPRWLCTHTYKLHSNNQNSLKIHCTPMKLSDFSN